MKGRKSAWGFCSQNKERGPEGEWATGCKEVAEKDCSEEGAGGGGVGGMGMTGSLGKGCI